MKHKIKEIIRTAKQKLITVQLDYKTIMTLTKISSLKVWLEKYPDAKVISS